jgi:hypothetical protein
MGSVQLSGLGYSRVRRPFKFLALAFSFTLLAFLHILISQKANHQHSTLAFISAVYYLPLIQTMLCCSQGYPNLVVPR